MDFLGKRIETFRRTTSGSSIIGGKFKPKQPRDVYYMYQDDYGFAAQKANHLVQYSKQKGYILKYKKAEELLNDPPKPPKKRLENGGFEWSDTEEDETKMDEDSDDLSIHTDTDEKTESDGKQIGRKSVWEQQKTSSSNPSSNSKSISDFDKLCRTQLIEIGDIPKVNEMSKYVLPTTRSEVSRQQSLMMEDFTDNSLLDDSGYSLIPFTNHLIINFHLDISTKQWSEVSRTFLKAINDLLKIKKTDYTILSVTKHEKNRLESRICFLMKKFNDKWPDYRENIPLLKHELDDTLAPLKRTFKDSGHLLKMLKKLQFSEIDTGEKNQVDRKEFDAYFNTNSVEPLDPQVLANLFNTLDADGDGEITALEFFKWKISFSQNKLTSMFPIIAYQIYNQYKNCDIPRLKAGLNEIHLHSLKHLQDFPLQLTLDDIYYVNHSERYNKYQQFHGFRSSKLLFLVHKTNVNGLNENDIHGLLKNAIGKKGKYFDDKGFYGAGYYFTSHIEYALNDIFFNEISDFGNNKSSTNQQYTLIACLVNPGKITFLKDYSRGKKIKSSDTNCIQHIIGDWNDELFGAPESYYNQRNIDNDNQHYTDYNGASYDCYVVKNHERILPRYILTFSRIKQCFIWMDEKFETIKESAQKLIAAREKLKQFMPNVIYGGHNMDSVIKLIRLKMKYNSVFLLRFVGIDVHINLSLPSFIKYIGGNVKNVKIKVYPITIIYNITTKQQIWNLILRNNKNKKCTNIQGSAKQMFKYIRDNLGGNKLMKKIMTNKFTKNTHKNGSVSVLVISIKFVKKASEIDHIIQQQIEDAKKLEKELKNEEYDEDDDGNYDEEESKEEQQKKDIEEEEMKQIENNHTKPFKIEITSADKRDSALNVQSARELNEEERMKEMLNEERIESLLELELPEDVSEHLGDPKSYPLPKEEKESMQNLEREIGKISEGLYNQTGVQRKYSKLAILKHYQCLSTVYDRYCILGGDRHWLNNEGFMWMLRDSSIPEKDTACTTKACKQLFQITYKMHHRLLSRYQSKHKIQLSSSSINEFNDTDPWSGVWKPKDGKDATNNSYIYKLRRIGDQRLYGCINNINYADISGTFDSLNYKKAELEIKYHQRRRAGGKRIWKCELIAPKTITDNISMKVTWSETNQKVKGSQAKTGKLHLQKTDKLSDDDIDLPKNELIGLSKHEFFDLMLSIATTKYNNHFEFQYQMIHRLITDHIDSYIYKNILENNLNQMETNEIIKKQMRSKNLNLRKLFKMYASLDSDESADDDGLGQDEWCTFAVDLCKTAKSLNKKIWTNGGKPSFDDMKSCFILSKGLTELDQDEIDFVNFNRCVLNLTNKMFKHKPDAKYEILSFQEKLDLVFAWIDKMAKQTATPRSGQTMKKLRKKSGATTPTSKRKSTPTSTSKRDSGFPTILPVTKK